MTPGIERVQALADIPRSGCVHSNEARAPIANHPSYIRVRAVMWVSGEGQTDRQTRTHTHACRRAGHRSLVEDTLPRRLSTSPRATASRHHRRQQASWAQPDGTTGEVLGPSQSVDKFFIKDVIGVHTVLYALLCRYICEYYSVLWY